MSNILIIKHGSLGDLIQANGAIKDIKNFYKNRKVFLLTSEQYAIFMSECPYIDGVIIDKRLPRWNLFYFNNLKKKLIKRGLNNLYKKLYFQNSCFVHRDFHVSNIMIQKNKIGVIDSQDKIGRASCREREK